MGGRKRPKLADNIFDRKHNLTAPGKGDDKPVFMVDNPSRDFYFPVTVKEVKETIALLPKDHTHHLTHVWFQKIRKSDYLKGETFQASFICGSGVYLIVLHPFPRDNKMRLGKTKPLKRILNYYKDYTTQLDKDKDGWFLLWTEAQIKKYYLQSLLLHEIGHSIDSFCKRYWSPANQRKTENRADNYAAVWADQLRETYESV